MMERGSIRFIYEDGKTPSIEATLVNGTIFLTKYEIAHLLNCFVQKIDTNIRSILKENCFGKKIAATLTATRTRELRNKPFTTI